MPHIGLSTGELLFFFNNQKRLIVTKVLYPTFLRVEKQTKRSGSKFIKYNDNKPTDIKNLENYYIENIW